jgi:hypothetical protein
MLYGRKSGLKKQSEGFVERIFFSPIFLSSDINYDEEQLSTGHALLSLPVLSINWLHVMSNQ